RGVGGFWPARGHPAARDWFSDEHHAQREMVRSGWRLEFAADAAVERLIEPRARDILARRARYGARLGAIGRTRPRGVAARQAAGSLAGVPLAGARGRALERLARAAENAAVVAGEPLARRHLRPEGTSPFRAHVPAAKRGRRAPQR